MSTRAASNISDEVLDLAVYMANSSYLRCVVVLKIFTASLGIVLMLTSLCQKYVFTSTNKWQLAHRSLVMLLAQHFFWTFLMSLFILLDNCITAYVFATWTSDQNLFLYKDSVSCFHRVFWAVLTFHGSITSIVVVTFERALAYLYRSNYENSKRRIGCYLTVTNLLFTALLQFGVYIHFDFERTAAYCSVLSPKSIDYHQLMGVVILSLELFTIASYVKLLRMNKLKLAGGCQTLTERYQLSENIRSLEYLIPAVSSTIIINIFAIVVFIIVSSLPIEFGERSHALSEESVNFLHIHAIVLPIVLYRNNRKEERSHKQVLDVNRTKRDELANNHIKVIQKLW